ncbi:hypothetical protein BH11MYX3_BH11MYX3_10340 [soil metagenome]
MKIAIAATTAVAVTVTSLAAHAFCGFYVSGSGQKMFNDATQVVLMRAGTRTVLSMQNDYRGPLEDFAMVVPVPVVLKEGDVKVVPKAVLDRLDSLGSPRLVEYWEQDPCPPPAPPPRPYDEMSMAKPSMQRMPSVSMGSSGEGRPSVRADKAARMAIPPVLASFTADPPVLTAGVATKITWDFQYSNQPWPEPACTVDHSVGRVASGQATTISLNEGTMYTLTCANSAGRSSKQFKINTVKIEAKYDVAEYQILILSAAEATGLGQWLNLNKYKIPDGAEPLLRPYVESGMKFFVAKVDPKKVQMVDGHAALSPLRFSYDSEDFSLPIRLGMANSSGKQDLIVNIISADKRYEVANYKNTVIPTNFDVKPSVKQRFTEFYAALFDKTVEANPGAVITEYAWQSHPSPMYNNSYHCDPCPPVIPNDDDMISLGADLIGGTIQQGGYVLTRLHARYGKSDMKDDLRFREAAPITGGREVWSKQGLQYGASPASENNFQARYAIRYWWTGPMRCKNPQRGVWGGPPNGGNTQVMAANKTAFAPRGKLELASVIKRDLWEIGYKKSAPAPKVMAPAKTKAMSFVGGAFGGLLFCGLGLLLARRRRATAG